MADPRISARRGRVVDLNVDFYNNGVLTDPFSIRRVEIYKGQALPHNLVSTIPIVTNEDASYPYPLKREYDDQVTYDGATGAVATPGKYHLELSIPGDFAAPEVYLDVWYYFADDPRLDSSEMTVDLDDAIYDPYLLKCCHRFWVYPDEWLCDDGLQNIRFGFEPLDQKFYSPEQRPLEVGLMPLPLYDYNFNLVNPMIPFINATISIFTGNCELLVDDAPCRIGLRQGSYRSNPWVLQYDLNTANFLKGTYYYQIKLTLPNGSTRVSKRFVITIS